MDDVAPKETGRDAVRDARQERGRLTHGAHAAAEEDRGVGPDIDVYGGGGGDGDADRRRLEQANARKRQRTEERVTELRAKEATRNSDGGGWMNKLNIPGLLEGGGKIKIQPRAPPPGP